MKFKINPGLWGQVFAVPASLVDEHLRRASGQQLKVFLFILRHSGEIASPKEAARLCGMREDDFRDALQYWLSYGLLIEEGKEQDAEENLKLSKASEQGTKGNSDSASTSELRTTRNSDSASTSEQGTTRNSALPDILPTHEQVALRVSESPELSALFNEAQLIMGRTIGYDIQAKLLMIYDQYGLPAEVILTLIKFAVSQGKSTKYIEKVAADWAEKGIVSLEDADSRIRELEKGDRLWNGFVKSFTENFSSSERPFGSESRKALLRKWRLEFKQSEELVLYALERTVNNTNKLQFSYADKMLCKWHERGLATSEAVEKAEASERAGASGRTGSPKKAKRSGGAVKPTSYDLSKYMEKASRPIEYTKRER